MTRNSRMWLPLLSLLGLAGCSDPLPPPYEASAQFQIASGAPAGASCPFMAHVTNFGDTVPSASSPGTVLVDGKKGAEVNCSVSGEGPFNFEGTVAIPTARLTFFAGTAVQGGEGQATGIFRDPIMARTLQSDATQPCIISVNEGSLSVEKGSIWAKFSCPKIGEDSQPNIWCQASGFFVFRSCDE